jgi:N-acyl homoserine lactone hydrolase
VLIVPTPGHTFGHQSVILRDGEVTYLFAGDTSYTEKFMVDGVVDGVSPNPQVADNTMLNIQTFLRSEPAVYLPSHDPMSAERMVHQIRTKLT